MFVLKKTMNRQVSLAYGISDGWRHRAINAEREVDNIHRSFNVERQSHLSKIRRLEAKLASVDYREAVLNHEAAVVAAVAAREAYEKALNAKRSPEYGHNVAEAAAALAGALKDQETAASDRKQADRTRQDTHAAWVSHP